VRDRPVAPGYDSPDGVKSFSAHHGKMSPWKLFVAPRIAEYADIERIFEQRVDKLAGDLIA
jgi:hypothetical protein